MLTHPHNLKRCIFPFHSTEWDGCYYWDNLEFNPTDFFLKEIVCKLQYSISDKVAGNHCWSKRAAMLCLRHFSKGETARISPSFWQHQHLSTQVKARGTATRPTKETRSHRFCKTFSSILQARKLSRGNQSNLPSLFKSKSHYLARCREPRIFKMQNAKSKPRMCLKPNVCWKLWYQNTFYPAWKGKYNSFSQITSFCCFHSHFYLHLSSGIMLVSFALPLLQQFSNGRQLFGSWVQTP